MFLIFLSASSYRKSSKSSFLSFSEYNNFEKCSTPCCGGIIIFDVLDLLAPLSDFKWDQDSFGSSVSSDSL